MSSLLLSLRVERDKEEKVGARGEKGSGRKAKPGQAGCEAT